MQIKYGVKKYCCEKLLVCVCVQQAKHWEQSELLIDIETGSIRLRSLFDPAWEKKNERGKKSKPQD